MRGIRVSGSNFGESRLAIWVSESNFEIWKKFLVSEWKFWPKNKILGDGMPGFWQFDFEIWVRQSSSPLRSNLVSDQEIEFSAVDLPKLSWRPKIRFKRKFYSQNLDFELGGEISFGLYPKCEQRINSRRVALLKKNFPTEIFRQLSEMRILMKFWFLYMESHF